MTAGSYSRNLRKPTSGKYSGPYTVGLLDTKTWSGDNMPSGKPNRTNVFPIYDSVKTVVRYRKVIENRKAIHYVYKYTSLIHLKKAQRERELAAAGGGITPVYSSRGAHILIGYKRRIPVVRYYRKIVRVPYTVTTVRPRKYRGSGNERKPKRARLDEHFYTANWNASRSCVVNYVYPGVGNFSNASTSIVSSYTVQSGWTSNDDLKLIDKLRTRVAGSEFNAGIAFAELPRTLSLITSSATKIYKALNAVKRGDVVSAANYLLGRKALRNRKFDKEIRSSRRTIQENWLQLQYGWRPLVEDVYNGAQFLAHHLNVPLQQTLRVSREVAGSVTFNGTAGWKYEQSSVITRASIKAVLKEKDVPALLGLQDPASVAWELVPYSFVADWFVPIGTYLSARGLSQSLSGTFVTSKKYAEVHSGFVPFNQPIIGISYSGGVSLAKGSFTRNVSSTLQVPLPSWKPLAKVASWQHCANAVALLTSTSFKWK